LFRSVPFLVAEYALHHTDIPIPSHPHSHAGADQLQHELKFAVDIGNWLLDHSLQQALEITSLTSRLVSESHSMVHAITVMCPLNFSNVKGTPVRVMVCMLSLRLHSHVNEPSTA
jgi:hypothetical protein